jgi:hypothetical protein
MSRAQRQLVQWFVMAVLVAVGIGFLFGAPVSAGSPGWGPWWSHGAQLSDSTADNALLHGSFFSDDVVSRGVSHALDWIARVGIRIWNPLALHPFFRWVTIAVFSAAVAGVIWDIGKRLFRPADDKAATD